MASRGFTPHRTLCFAERSMRGGAGFTLVELMVAVSILAGGLVFIGRAFLAGATALETAQHRLEATQFLEAKMDELYQQAREHGGIQPEHREGVMELDHRPATWICDIVTVTLKEPSDALESSEATDELAEARLSLVWAEGPRAQDVVLVTYLDAKRPAP